VDNPTMSDNRIASAVFRAAGSWHTVGLETPEKVQAFHEAHYQIHDGAWAARGRAERGEITAEEAEQIIRQARIQRHLRRSRG